MQAQYSELATTPRSRRERAEFARIPRALVWSQDPDAHLGLAVYALEHVARHRRLPRPTAHALGAALGLSERQVARGRACLRRTGDDPAMAAIPWVPVPLAVLAAGASPRQLRLWAMLRSLPEPRYPRTEWLAARAKTSQRSIQRDLQALVRLGLAAHGRERTDGRLGRTFYALSTSPHVARGENAGSSYTRVRERAPFQTSSRDRKKPPYPHEWGAPGIETESRERRPSLRLAATPGSREEALKLLGFTPRALAMNPRFGKEPRRAVTGLCPHGRPDGAYCKRCAASAEASGVAVADAPVTLPERVAGRVLELWNEHVCDLGRGYEPFPDSYLPIIARRCAERPDVGEGMHAAIVDAFFDGTWWDRPLPDFVYGSTLQFDRALDKARGTLAAAARGKLRPLEPVPEPQPREERSAIVAGILESLADEIAAARRSA